MSFTNGNCLAQFGSNSSLKPFGIRSVLNVIVQVLSRSALANSQGPLRSFAAESFPDVCAEGGVGACSVGACGAGACADAALAAINRQKRAAVRMGIAYRFGGQGVSGTGVSGALPAAQARMLSTTS